MKLVLIGGGDFGVVPNKPYNLSDIDSEIFNMTGKAHPRILFIGFNERANYIFGAFKKKYIELGAMCEYLKFTELENQKTVESKMKRADAIYIGGGNSLEYISEIKRTGLDVYIKDAAQRGVILCGISAGAICYSKSGMSDAGNVDEVNFIRAEGLGFFDAMFCPHYLSSAREIKLPEFLKSYSEVAICVCDGVSVFIEDDKYRLVKCGGVGKAYKCFYSGDEFVRTEIADNGKLDELLLKQ